MTEDLDRARWLEAHDEFEGVGAHELNPRYAHVDGGEWDQALADRRDDHATPVLLAAQARALVAAKATPIRLDGIDISHWQYDKGTVSWPIVAGIPTFWGATKLTQSTKYLDPTAARCRREMAVAGIRQRGLYHWLSSTTSPVEQGRWFMSCAGELHVGEFAMCDAEEAGVTVDKVLAWCETVEAFTHRPCAVYTGAYVAGGSIWTDQRIRTSKYGPRAMILAAYTTEARARALPGVAANPWSSWQFSSDGPVAGITGRCDMNRVDDRAVYDHACGLDVMPTPEPEPTPPSTPANPNKESDRMLIFTNTETFFDIPPGEAAFGLLDEGKDAGKLRTLTQLEWDVRGRPSDGTLSNAQIGALGVIAEA